MTEATKKLEDLSDEGPIFAEGRFARHLSGAANKYLDDEYVYSPDDDFADHELTDFEHQLVADFLGGLFAWEPFSTILHSLIEKQTAKAEIERLQARVAEFARLLEEAKYILAIRDLFGDKTAGEIALRITRALLNSPALPKESITDGWVRR